MPADENVPTRAWLTALLTKAFPLTLQRCAEARPISVPDYVRLVELRRKWSPSKKRMPEIRWVEPTD